MLLSSGYTMPKMGFGTSSVLAPEVFYTAVKVGYRDYHTATRYKNEEQLGESL
jgi:diketogulonate reductase-like aldo/keto reductase